MGNSTDKTKIEYWHKRMEDELEKGFKSTLEHLNKAKEMAEFVGIDGKAFQDGVIEIGDGFNSLKALIDRKPVIKRKVEKK